MDTMSEWQPRRLESSSPSAAVEKCPKLVPSEGLPQMRRLGSRDLPALERHLLELAPADRRARFLSTCADEMIAAYARRIDVSHAILVGAFDTVGRLVGVAEAHSGDKVQAVEVAVSVDLAYRRQGLGCRLVAHVLAAAFAAGAGLADFNFHPNNNAMVGLVLGLGGSIKTAQGYASITSATAGCSRFLQCLGLSRSVP